MLPGPVAAVTAYVASGFTCPRFYFGGFFPRKQGDRARALESLAALDAVAIYYESPHRIVEALQSVAGILPDRFVAVCRELTKLHEEVLVGPATLLAEQLAQRQASEGIKGEIVLVIDVPDKDEKADAAQVAKEQAATRAVQLLAQGVSKKEVVARLRAEYGISRNAAYDLVHGS